MCAACNGQVAFAARVPPAPRSGHSPGVAAVSETPALILASRALAATLAAAVVRSRLRSRRRSLPPPERRARGRGRRELRSRRGTRSPGSARPSASSPRCSCSLRAAVVRGSSTRSARSSAFARGSARRLLALVFAVAALVTAMLSLDATVVLLTPVVFVTAVAHAHEPEAARLCLLAPRELRVPAAAGLQPHEPARVPRERALVRALRRAHGAPWLVALASSGPFSRASSAPSSEPRARRRRPPARAALAAASHSRSSAATLAGFALSSLLAVAPVGSRSPARSRSAPPRSRDGRRRSSRPRGRAGLPLFVLALGVIVPRPATTGSSRPSGAPPGRSRPTRSPVIAGACAVLGEPRQQPPAILIVLPALAGAAGPGRCWPRSSASTSARTSPTSALSRRCSGAAPCTRRTPTSSLASSCGWRAHRPGVVVGRPPRCGWRAMVRLMCALWCGSPRTAGR